jgi:cytochrome c peroxidase
MYMHDGRFNTLEEVIDHYNDGIKNNPNLDMLLKQYDPSDYKNPYKPQNLKLTEVQKKGLVDFLRTLTDKTIVSDTKFSDPFVPRQ